MKKSVASSVLILSLFGTADLSEANHLHVDSLPIDEGEYVEGASVKFGNGKLYKLTEGKHE